MNISKATVFLPEAKLMTAHSANSPPRLYPEITGYPTTYIVDGDGNICGAPIIGNVGNQKETLQKRIDTIVGAAKE